VPQVQFGRWSPAIVVPTVVAFAVFGSLLLKKGH